MDLKDVSINLPSRFGFEKGNQQVGSEQEKGYPFTLPENKYGELLALIISLRIQHGDYESNNLQIGHLAYH